MNRDLKEYLSALGFPERQIESAQHRQGHSAAAPVATPVTRVQSEEVDLDNEWAELEAQAKKCLACRLAQSRTQVVFGTGHRQARLMFVGEGPGQEEDLQGLPFVGAAGQLLTKMIQAMGLRREDVYIANVVKCRPPQNRNPEPDEIAACSGYLERQIALVDPEIIVALGTFAAQTLLKTEASIGRLRGEFQEAPTLKRRSGEAIALLPTYHPAFLLRNPAMKKPVWDDLQKVMGRLGLQRMDA